METNADPEDPLLQNCPDCGTVMDVSSVEPLSAVTCPNCGAPSVVSTMIDHFELIDIIGHGGMGAVYKAHDTSLDRPVALKLLKKSSGSPEQIAQLETEAAITASINHPHVVRVFTTGTDHGRFYIAMELVERGTLDNLIDLQGRVAEAQVLEVGIQIASGLRAAQHAGLIHRDVKPGNILFADAHTAKIVDFGLAIFAEDEAKVRGEIWGTPYYVAPEKLDNKPEDFRSDIYSLGGTLFHALAGRPPFEAENASLVALKHLKNQAVSLQAFAPQVSGSTAYVINRTLSKDPEKRYQSYDELIEHLEYARTQLQEGSGKPAQTNRVVMETEDDKKAMGWITFGLLGLIVLLAILAFAFRGRVFSSGETATATAAGGQVKFPAAYDRMADGHPAEAADILSKTVAQKPGQPLQSWAEMLEGLARLAAGQKEPATEIFTRIQTQGPYSKKDADKPLAQFFLTVAAQMAKGQPIPPSSVQDGNTLNYEPIALLFYGVNNWQLGQPKDGVELLRRFRQATPMGTNTWVEDLKPIATRYIEDFTASEMAFDRGKNAKTIDEKKSAVTALRAVQGNLAGKAKEIADRLADEVSKVEKERAALFAQGKIPDGRYRLINRKSNKSIDVGGRSKDDGQKVQQWAYGNQPNQQWNISALGNGFYLLLGVDSGKALSIPQDKTDDNVPIQQSNVSKGPTQKWKIERVENNIYKLTVEATGKALSVIGDTNGGGIVQAPYTGAQEQQWKIENP